MNNDEKKESIDWGHILRRKDRPLPPRGCSIAFYIFFVALVAILIAFFLIYNSH